MDFVFKDGVNEVCAAGKPFTHGLRTCSLLSFIEHPCLLILCVENVLTFQLTSGVLFASEWEDNFLVTLAMVVFCRVDDS